MSSPALFGSSVTRGAIKNLVEIKAGKMTMKGKMVYPDNRKGQLYIYQSEDSLIHFCWKDRSSGIVEDDLIIFPDDCEFVHVKQCKTGRVYLLRFKSSSRKFFFWLQDAKTDMDEERCKKINDILNNPPTLNSQRTSSTNPEGDLQNLLNNMSQQQLMQLFGGVGHISGLGTLLGSMNRPYNSNRMPPAVASNPRSPSSNSIPSTETSENKQENDSVRVNQSSNQPKDTTPNNSGNNRIHLSDLQNFLSEIPVSNDSGAIQQNNLAYELSAAISANVSINNNLESTLKEFLPENDTLVTIISTPQFTEALSTFWNALISGQIAPIIQQFGFSKDVTKAAAKGNIKNFLVALEAEAKHSFQSHDDHQKNVDIVSTHDGNKQFQNENAGDDKKDGDDENMALD